MVSSYVRVQNNLMELPATKELVADLAAGFMEPSLNNVEGQTIHDYSRNIENTYSIYRMKFNCPSGLKLSFVTRSQDTDFSINNAVFGSMSKKSRERLDARITNILDAAWKTKACPTFNCKKSKVLENLISRVKHVAVEGVDNVLWSEKISALMTEAVTSGSTAEAEAEALRLKAQKDILEAMKPFRNVPDALIQEVISQYLFDRIMAT